MSELELQKCTVRNLGDAQRVCALLCSFVIIAHRGEADTSENEGVWIRAHS